MEMEMTEKRKPGDEADNARERWRRRAELFDAGDFDRELEELSGDPDAGLYLLRGISRLSLGRYEDAIANFDRVLELHPNNARALGDRGCAYMKLGEWEKALADLEKAVELRPQDDTARQNLEIAWKKGGK